MRFLLGLLVVLMCTQARALDDVPTDVVDCVAAASRFEISLCANLGAFDTINHIHQRVVFAPDMTAAEPIQLKVQRWLADVEIKCMAHDDVRLASDCIYAEATGPGADQLNASVEALYMLESDIEGDLECDGCEEAVSVVGDKPTEGIEPKQSAQLGPEAATSSDSRRELVELYMGYQMVALCADNRLYFDENDVEAMKVAATDAEALLTPDQREAAWQAANDEGGDAGRLLFQIDYDQSVQMCEGLRLFVGGTITDYRRSPTKPF